MDYERMKTLRKGAKLELKTVHHDVGKPQLNSGIKLIIESDPIIRSDPTSNGMVNWAEFGVKILKVTNPKSPITVDDSVNTLVASQVMQSSGTPKENVRLNNYDVEDVKMLIPSLKKMAFDSALKYNPDGIYHNQNPAIVNLLEPS